jgi:hypothetical protein
MRSRKRGDFCSPASDLECCRGARCYFSFFSFLLLFSIRSFKYVMCFPGIFIQTTSSVKQVVLDMIFFLNTSVDTNDFSGSLSPALVARSCTFYSSWNQMLKCVYSLVLITRFSVVDSREPFRRTLRTKEGELSTE